MLGGCLTLGIPNNGIVCIFLRSTSVGQQQLKFWETEEIPKRQLRFLEEEKFDAHFAITVSRTAEGHFIVSIPFKASVSGLR